MDDAELKRVAEAATPGPWSSDRADAPGASWEVWGHDGSDYENFVADCRIGRANATYIATFDPPTVLGLLSRLSAAEAKAGVLEEALRAISRMRRDLDPAINMTTLSAAVSLAQSALTQEPTS
jgi:hypothetical protein